MANSVYIGMSAAIAAQQRLEVAAQNVANSNTVGFRQQRVQFSDVLVGTLDGAPSQKGFTSVVDTVVDTQAGPIQHTGNPLDLAIGGDGYFLVETPQGLQATRAGNFQLSAEGTLVDATGLPVMAGGPDGAYFPVQTRPEGGPVSVAADGLVEQDGTPLAKIAVVTVGASELAPAGGARLQVDPAALELVASPRLEVGYVEGSNINPVRGMVELIEISQDYQSASKLMSESRNLDRVLLR